MCECNHGQVKSLVSGDLYRYIAQVCYQCVCNHGQVKSLVSGELYRYIAQVCCQCVNVIMVR